jgi:hypothetical protein
MSLELSENNAGKVEVMKLWKKDEKLKQPNLSFEKHKSNTKRLHSWVKSIKNMGIFMIPLSQSSFLHQIWGTR